MERNQNNQNSDDLPTQQKNSDISSTLTESQPLITPNISNTPPTSPNKVSKKFILIGLVFLITVVAISITFYFRNQGFNPSIQESPQNAQEPPSPPPDLTSDWKTYRNEVYGFEFKYPSVWENQPGNSDNVIFQMGEYFEGGDPGSASPLRFYASGQPYEIIFALDIKNDGTEVINKESVIIDNNVYKLETHKQFEVEAAFKIIDYIPIKNLEKSEIYLYFSHTIAGCSIIPPPDQKQCFQNNEANIVEYRNIRNQILSTFRFLPDTSDWKIYINDKYNYSVEHPTFISANPLTENDIYLSHISFKDPTNQEDYKFSIRVRESSLDEEVNLIKNQTLGHVMVSLESEKRFTKNGYDGIRLDFVPNQSDNVIPFTNIILHNGVYSYAINASTKYIDQILSTFEFIK